MERSRRTPCSRKSAGLEVRSCALAVEEATGPKGADSRRNESMSTVWAVRSGCSSCLRLEVWSDEEGAVLGARGSTALPPFGAVGPSRFGAGAGAGAGAAVRPVCHECRDLTSMALWSTLGIDLFAVCADLAWHIHSPAVQTLPLILLSLADTCGWRPCGRGLPAHKGTIILVTCALLTALQLAAIVVSAATSGIGASGAIWAHSPTLHQFDGAGWIGALRHPCFLANHICFFDCLVGSMVVTMGSWQCPCCRRLKRSPFALVVPGSLPPARSLCGPLVASFCDQCAFKEEWTSLQYSSSIQLDDLRRCPTMGRPWGHQHKGGPVTDTSGVPGPGRGRVACVVALSP